MMSEDIPLPGSAERYFEAQRLAEVARAEKFRGDMEARRPAPPLTIAEKNAEQQDRQEAREERAAMKKQIAELGRAVNAQAGRIRALTSETQTLRSVVAALQRQGAPAAGQVRTRDHLDDELERGLITD